MNEPEPPNEDNESTDSSSEEEIEPKFKYIRITNDLIQIWNKEIITCSEITSKVYKMFVIWFIN